MLSTAFIYALAAIGFIVIGRHVVRGARGLARAARQSGRICAILARGSDRPISVRDRVRMFLRELGTSYDTISIGPWRLPYDGRGRITRAYRYPF